MDSVWMEYVIVTSSTQGRVANKKCVCKDVMGMGFV